MRRTHLALIPAFLLSFATGIGLHLAGHGTNCAVWHVWMVFHLLTGSVFLAAAAVHAVLHRKWYEALVRGKIGRRGRVTAILSAVFAAVVVTGVVLLGVEGVNTKIGLWHYRLGLLVGVLASGHAIRRISVLRALFRK